MKFTEAWAKLAQENVILKFAILSLSMATITLVVLLYYKMIEPPLLIERSCVTGVIKQSGNDHTKEEISAFVKLVLPQRFDSNATPSKNYIGPDELSKREGEQKDLAAKAIKQEITVEEIEVSDKGVEVTLDRKISVGAIKSILPMRLSLVINSEHRTTDNPYGLILSAVKPVTEKEKKE